MDGRVSDQEKHFLKQKAHQAKDLDAENQWNHVNNFAMDLDTGERVSVEQVRFDTSAPSALTPSRLFYPPPAERPG
jgi:hypothetical protein